MTFIDSVNHPLATNIFFLKSAGGDHAVQIIDETMNFYTSQRDTKMTINLNRPRRKPIDIRYKAYVILQCILAIATNETVEQLTALINLRDKH